MDLVDLLTNDACLSLSVALKKSGRELINARQTVGGLDNQGLYLLGLCLSSRSLGHTCLPLSMTKQVISGLNPEVEFEADNQFEALVCDLIALGEDSRGIRDRLNKASGEANLVGLTESDSDFVVYWSQVYRSPVLQTRAMYKLDNEIASHIKQKLALPVLDFTEEGLGSSYKTLSQGQIEAVVTGLNNGISVVTGGAGTGKSLVITTIIKQLIESRNARIGVSAPTARAVRIIKDRLGKQLANEGQLKHTHFNTLHRYAGRGQVEGYETESLEYLIVDEVSMVDNELMAQVFRRLNPLARVILVGDANQLPSVDEGSIFGSLVGAFESNPIHRARFKRLAQNFRIEGRGDVDLRFEIPKRLVSSTKEVQIPYLEIGNDGFGFFPADDSLPRFYRYRDDDSYAKKLRLRSSILTDYVKKLDEGNPPLIICSQRSGFWGSETINELIRDIIGGAELKKGVPIMVTRNDFKSGLSNGDRGLVADPVKRLVDFESHKSVSLDSLNHFELSFAITIHKSQGSTYEFALVVLGDTKRTLNKQLLYTALTRTSKNYSVVGSETSYLTALERDGLRYCLIGDMLDTIS